MDDQVIEYLSNRIRASYKAITKNMAPNDEDDCVQEVLLQYHKNGRGQTVDQAVIDYLRKTTGRKDNPDYEMRLNLKSGVELSEDIIFDEMKPDAIDLSLVHGRSREVISLSCEGYSQKEIGEKLGVTESRVSQLLEDAIAEYQVMSLVPKNLREWVFSNAFKRRNASFR